MIPVCCCCGKSPGVWNDPKWYADGGTQDFCPEHAKPEMVEYIRGDVCAARWSVKPIFAWYDLWVGIFWDSRKRKLYILPLPCVGVVIEFPIVKHEKPE